MRPSDSSNLGFVICIRPVSSGVLLLMRSHDSDPRGPMWLNSSLCVQATWSQELGCTVMRILNQDQGPTVFKTLEDVAATMILMDGRVFKHEGTAYGYPMILRWPSLTGLPRDP